MKKINKFIEIINLGLQPVSTDITILQIKNAWKQI